jgi:hypothetical protein
MNQFIKSRNVSWLLCAIIWLMLLAPAGARETKTDFSAADETNETARAGDIGVLQGAPYTYGVFSITEGMRDYPITKQLTNSIPWSFDVSVIFAIGWTGDKLYIKVTDDYKAPVAGQPGDPGDRIIGIAVAQYNDGNGAGFGSLFSSTTDNSFEIVIPVYAPGLTVYLMTGFWGKSRGENPYAYKIILSFPE